MLRRLDPAGAKRPEERSELFGEHFWGLCRDEVAAALGSTAKAVYQALARIHKALFDCVERGLTANAAAGEATR